MLSSSFFLAVQNISICVWRRSTQRRVRLSSKITVQGPNRNQVRFLACVCTCVCVCVLQIPGPSSAAASRARSLRPLCTSDLHRNRPRTCHSSLGRDVWSQGVTSIYMRLNQREITSESECESWWRVVDPHLQGSGSAASASCLRALW